jgi:hypothetical protein
MSTEYMKKEVLEAVEDALITVNWGGDVTTVLLEAAVNETGRHGGWTRDAFLQAAAEAWDTAEVRRQKKAKTCDGTRRWCCRRTTFDPRKR